MSTLPQSSAKAGSRPPLDPQNPWPGLDSFRETDQEFFRGRAGDAAELLALVQRSQISVLYGISGIGKSSLLEAGLFPLLRQNGMLPIRIRLDYSNENSDLVGQVKQAISQSAKKSDAEAPLSGELETLWEYFHRRDQSFWDSRNRLLTPVLILDQFEELFTLGTVRGVLTERAREFITQVADLAEGSPPAALREWLEEHPEDASQFLFGRHQYRLLISMREDFLAQLDDFRTSMPSIVMNRKRLLPMDGIAALEAADQAPDLMPMDVAESVVRFVAASDAPDCDLSELIVDPALLSVMCSELNEKRKRLGERAITAGLLEGSREEIVRDFYERAMGEVGAAVRTFIEEKLIIDPGYRDTVALDLALQSPGVTRDDIDQLVRLRLLRVERRGAVRRVELTHDLLVGVILESRNKRHAEENSEREKAGRIAAEERARLAQRALRKTRLVAGVLVLLSVAALVAAIAAFLAQSHANLNKQIAEDAVDKLAGLAGSHSVEVPDEAPETITFREQLLSNAQTIYQRFNRRDQDSEDLRKGTAMEHFRSGDLYRLRGDVQNAIAQYQIAIQQLNSLMRDFPNDAQYAKDLGDAYDWLGETERPFANQSADAQKIAENAYDNAIKVQHDPQALAQSYDNRGILRAAVSRYDDAEADYRKAISLLTPLAQSSESRQALAQTNNNLAQLIYNANRPGDARGLYNQAIQLGEALVKSNPTNREYKLQLADYYNNTAILLQERDPAVAKQQNQRAIDLLSELIQPAPYLAMQLALFHTTQGSIFEGAGIGDARGEYQLAIAALKTVPPQSRTRDYHMWLGQALSSMAELPANSKQSAIPLLQQAVEEQKAAGSNYKLVWNYYYLAEAYRDVKSFAEMQQQIRNGRNLLPTLSPADRQQLSQLLDGVTGTVK